MVKVVNWQCILYDQSWMSSWLKAAIHASGSCPSSGSTSCPLKLGMLQADILRDAALPPWWATPC